MNLKPVKNIIALSRVKAILVISALETRIETLKIGWLTMDFDIIEMVGAIVSAHKAFKVID